MSKKESISVIIPAYNAARFIGDALESVLGQTVPPDEIIVVDDGSTDETEAEVKKFDGNITYIYKENGGVSSARNRGLELVNGDLITFLDADDVWVENKLEMQLDLLRKKPEYEIIIGLLYRIPISKTEEIVNQEIEKGEYAASLGSSLMRKQVFEKVGNFDEELILSQDIDLFFRILEAGIKVLGHEDVVQFYRRHDQNLTRDEEKSNFYHLKAFRKSLVRRRKAGKKDSGMTPGMNKIGKVIDFWQ